jgi:hypothetical protein
MRQEKRTRVDTKEQHDVKFIYKKLQTVLSSDGHSERLNGKQPDAQNEVDFLPQNII